MNKNFRGVLSRLTKQMLQQYLIIRPQLLSCVTLAILNRRVTFSV